MAAVTRTEQMSNLLNPAIQAVYSQTQEKMAPPEYSQIFNEDDTNLYEYKESIMMGIGPTPIKYQGIAMEVDGPVQGWTKTYAQISYALAMCFTAELWKFDLFGKMREMARELALSNRWTLETLGANILNRGFNAIYLGGDGSTLFSTTHARTDGNTYSNRSATDADVSFTSIQAMLLWRQKMANEKGIPTPQTGPITIWVDPTKETIMDELLISPGKPYTANNEINALARKGIRYEMNHYLTGTNYWFGIPDKDSHQLKAFFAMKPGTPEHWAENITRNLYWSTMFMVAFGWTYPGGCYGSPGS